MNKTNNQYINEEEWFDIITPEGKVTGKAPRSRVHGNPDLLHAVVHLHVLDSRGRILLQKRAPDKKIQPEKWDTAVGGHVDSGEQIEQALSRESEEELGIRNKKFKPLYKYILRNDIESELVYTFLLIDDGPFTFDKKEITEIRFWEKKEIEEITGTGIFTPNFEDEYLMLIEAIGG